MLFYRFVIVIIKCVIIFVQLHPDVNPTDPDNHINFVRLNEAYTTLSNYSLRREYDFRLQHADRIQAVSQSYAAGYTQFHRLISYYL